MVSTPDVPDLPYRLQNGVKYFELIAESVKSKILPGLYINGWGYNGSIPGPTIQVYPGDYVNIRVVNHLPQATSVHWHGLDVPNVMDGVPEIEPSPTIMCSHIRCSKRKRLLHRRFRAFLPSKFHKFFCRCKCPISPCRQDLNQENEPM